MRCFCKHMHFFRISSTLHQPTLASLFATGIVLCVISPIQQFNSSNQSFISSRLRSLVCAAARLKLIESVWRNKNCKTEQCFPRNEWNQPFRRFCRLYIGHYGQPLLFLNVPILERRAPHRIHQWPSLKQRTL